MPERIIVLFPMPRSALKDWTRDPRITEEARKSQKLRTVIDVIQNPRFWLHLAELSDTISPTQTDHTHIGDVRGRWDATVLQITGARPADPLTSTSLTSLTSR